MKKVLSIALALVMVLSLSVTAFASNNVLDQTIPSGEISVNAKIVPMISAGVTWGNMEFTYYEAAAAWNALATNDVTVTNSSNCPISTSYTYARYDDGSGGIGETTMEAGWIEYGNSASEYVNPGVYIVSGENGGYVEASRAGQTVTTSPLESLGRTLYPNETQKFWLNFTTNLYVNTLPSSDFARVGTLTVTIAAA